jgi:3',5'-cyclic-AMP phosphodiesterase
MPELQPPLLTFVHLSDTHIHADPAFTDKYFQFSSRPIVEAVIDAVNALPFPIDFVLHTGDVMTDPDRPEHYQIAADILRRLRFPVYFIPGNHDRTEGMRQYLMPARSFTSSTYLYYELDINGVQILLLDSHVTGSAVGVITDDQLRWLDERCSREDERPLVVAVHHHPIRLGAPWLDVIPLANGVQLHQILLKARDRLRGVFYGHIHEDISTTRDGINYHSTFSSWFQTRTWYGQLDPFNDPIQSPGFNVVTLTPQDTFVRSYRVGLPADMTYNSQVAPTDMTQNEADIVKGDNPTKDVVGDVADDVSYG